MNRFQRSTRPIGQALVASTLLVFFAALIAAVLPSNPAKAVTESSNQISRAETKPSKPHSDRDNEDGNKEDEGDIGSEVREQHDHEGSLQIPPLVIKPRDGANIDRSGSRDGDQGFAGAAGSTPYDLAPVSGGPGDPLGGISGATPEGFAGFTPGGSPVGRHPIDLKQVKFSQPTPADVFMQSATVALGVMGVGALALVGVTASRGKLLRRKNVAQSKTVDYNSAD